MATKTQHMAGCLSFKERATEAERNSERDSEEGVVSLFEKELWCDKGCVAQYYTIYQDNHGKVVWDRNLFEPEQCAIRPT